MVKAANIYVVLERAACLAWLACSRRWEKSREGRTWRDDLRHSEKNPSRARDQGEGMPRLRASAERVKRNKVRESQLKSRKIARSAWRPIRAELSLDGTPIATDNADNSVITTKGNNNSRKMTEKERGRRRKVSDIYDTSTESDRFRIRKRKRGVQKNKGSRKRG